MMRFNDYLIRFLRDNPSRKKDVAEFIYNMPCDTYFGDLGERANQNNIDLYEADIETWIALIDDSKDTSH